MLAKPSYPIARQRGAVMVITLVALTAMILAATALTRSTDTAAGRTQRLAFDCASLAPDPAGACATDVSGNRVSYAIQRLCNTTGAPTAAGVDCSVSPANNATGSGKGSGMIALQYNSQVYYRITVRVDGPRNTVSYAQAIVAM
jgi:hypothetical protein